MSEAFRRVQLCMARGIRNGNPVLVRNFAVISIVNHEQRCHHAGGEWFRLEPLERDSDTIDDALFREWQDLIWESERREPLHEELVLTHWSADQHGAIDVKSEGNREDGCCGSHGVGDDRAEGAFTFGDALDGSGEAGDREPGAGCVTVGGGVEG
jgi:hypothetical protein